MQEQFYQAKPTTISTILKQWEKNTLSKKVEKYFEEIDIVLSDRHTQGLYNAFKWRKASILTQLWTEMQDLMNIYIELKLQNQTFAPVVKL